VARIHSDADILAACSAIAAEHGVDAVTRDTVQTYLKRVAEQRGQGSVGANTSTVAEIVCAFRQQRRNEEAAKRKSNAANGESADILPEAVQLAIIGGVDKLSQNLREAVLSIYAEGQAATRVAVQHANAEARERLDEVEALLAESGRQADELSAQLEETNCAIETSGREIDRLTRELAELSGAHGILERESRAQLAAAQAAIQDAGNARAAADARAHAAELKQQDVVAELRHAREQLQRVGSESAALTLDVERERIRVRDAERVQATEQGLRQASETECRRLREELDTLRARVAPPRVAKRTR
jgi:hypothetical protein